MAATQMGIRNYATKDKFWWRLVLQDSMTFFILKWTLDVKIDGISTNILPSVTSIQIINVWTNGWINIVKFGHPWMEAPECLCMCILYRMHEHIDILRYDQANNNGWQNWLSYTQPLIHQMTNRQWKNRIISNLLIKPLLDQINKQT